MMASTLAPLDTEVKVKDGRQATLMKKADQVNKLDPDYETAVIIIKKKVEGWTYESTPNLLASMGFDPPKGLVSTVGTLCGIMVTDCVDYPGATRP